VNFSRLATGVLAIDYVVEFGADAVVVTSVGRPKI